MMASQGTELLLSLGDVFNLLGGEQRNDSARSFC